MSCQKRLEGKKAKEKNNDPFQVGLINWIILLISITLWLLTLSVHKCLKHPCVSSRFYFFFLSLYTLFQGCKIKCQILITGLKPLLTGTAS